MLKDLIVIENGEKYQFDTLKELVEMLVDEQYYQLEDKEKAEKLELKAFANCMLTDREVVKNFDGTIDGKFIIKDEITYIYSLLLLNKIIILESTKSDYLTRELDKENITDNYIIVNHFASDLLKKYIGGSCGEICI